MRVSTGLFLGSAHVSTSYPAADGLSYFGSSVGFCACVSPVERALFATMSRARQLIEARTGDEEMRDDSEAMQNVSNRNQRVQQMQCNCIIRKFFCLGMMILLQFPIAVPGSDTMQVNLGYRTRTKDSRFNN